MGAIIFPARRAIEDAVSIPEVRPHLFFAVLWPLWQVEIAGEIDEAQNYDLLDRFVVRAVADAGIRHQTQIGQLLGLRASTVEGCLRHLVAIGHLSWEPPIVRLTDLGSRSHREGRRIVHKESRQLLLFDRFTTSPLPRTHYAEPVKVLHEPVAPPNQYFGPRLTPLFAAHSAFDEQAVTDLSRREDRSNFNLPAQLTDVRVLAISEVFLPVYLIRAEREILAYTAASDSRDSFFERICRQQQAILSSLTDTTDRDPRTRWTDWLAKKRVRGAKLIRTAAGRWRAEIPRDQFGAPPAAPFKFHQLASYEVHENHFLQLWSTDRKLRRRVMLDRTIALTNSPAISDSDQFFARCRAIADQLEVDPPTEDELRARFPPGVKSIELSRLEALLRPT